MPTYFKSSAVINSPKAFTYKGHGYKYVLSTDSDGTASARLCIPKKLLEEFALRVGAVNSVSIPRLHLWAQGGGWYIVTVMAQEFNHAVLQFLARLNRWVLKHKVLKVFKTEQADQLVFSSASKVFSTLAPSPFSSPAFIDKVYALATKYRPARN